MIDDLVFLSGAGHEDIIAGGEDDQ